MNNTAGSLHPLQQQRWRPLTYSYNIKSILNKTVITNASFLFLQFLIEVATVQQVAHQLHCFYPMSALHLICYSYAYMKVQTGWRVVEEDVCWKKRHVSVVGYYHQV